MVSKEVLSKIEECLDGIYDIVQSFGEDYPSEEVYYLGVLKGIELSGLFWERDSEGHHKVYSF